MGHKTLLIDNDLIRGDQHKFFNKSKISRSSFYEIEDNVLNKFMIQENLYFIPKISSISDTFNFLYDDAYLEKLRKLKNTFDYIIVDTAPVLSVSDTSILMSFADYNFLIVRHDVSRINDIKQAWFLSEQTNNEFDGISIMDIQNQNLIMGIMGYMEITDISIMHKNIYMKTTIKKHKMTNILKSLTFIIFFSALSSCSLSPGMYLQTESNWLSNESSVYVESLGES